LACFLFLILILFCVLWFLGIEFEVKFLLAEALDEFFASFHQSIDLLNLFLSFKFDFLYFLVGAADIDDDLG
jgi:hypothetical protein